MIAGHRMATGGNPGRPGMIAPARGWLGHGGRADRPAMAARPGDRVATGGDRHGAGIMAPPGIDLPAYGGRAGPGMADDAKGRGMAAPLVGMIGRLSGADDPLAVDRELEALAGGDGLDVARGPFDRLADGLRGVLRLG